VEKSEIVTNDQARVPPDPVRIQAVVDRRLAMRLGVSLPTAAVIAALAGLGPQAERRGR
jgi:hypothetical protein